MQLLLHVEESNILMNECMRNDVLLSIYRTFLSLKPNASKKRLAQLVIALPRLEYYLFTESRYNAKEYFDKTSIVKRFKVYLKRKRFVLVNPHFMNKEFDYEQVLGRWQKVFRCKMDILHVLQQKQNTTFADFVPFVKQKQHLYRYLVELQYRIMNFINDQLYK